MHRVNSFVLALALAFTVSSQVYAQAPDTRRDAPDAPSPRGDRSDDKDWGWVGLLGSAGLFGLMRRERVPDVRNRVATVLLAREARRSMNAHRAGRNQSPALIGLL